MDFKGMLAMQHAAIKASLAELNAAVDTYSSTIGKVATSDDPTIMAQLSLQQVKLTESVNQMQSAVYGPINMVTKHFEEFFRSGSVRALLEMGVFDELPMDGSGKSASELAAKLGVDEDLLVRLMRMAVPTFFKEPTPEVYTHTPNSMIYLMVPPLRGAFKMMFDEYGISSMKLTEYLVKNGFKNPNSLTDNPYTYAHDTKGLNMFEFLALDPVRFNNFNAAMQAKTAQTILPYNMFPFKDEFSKIETTDDSVLLVDIGGGNGQAATAIRQLCPGIKGKMILQDQPSVLDAMATALPGVEKMGYDFFAPQPVKGALIYYIRRCLHDWPEDACISILKNIAAVMVPGTSRLLISEIVLPPGQTDGETAWYDICMMQFSGMERSEKQWVSLLEKSGFKLVKIHGTDDMGAWIAKLVKADRELYGRANRCWQQYLLADLGLVLLTKRLPIQRTSP